MDTVDLTFYPIKAFCTNQNQIICNTARTITKWIPVGGKNFELNFLAKNSAGIVSAPDRLLFGRAYSDEVYFLSASIQLYKLFYTL